MFDRIGVRGRLLLAFFGISGFALLAAGMALYSFLEVGDAVNRITQRRVPMTLASLELSRQVERIVAVAPALLTVSTAEQHGQTSSQIEAQLKRLDELLANLKVSDINVEVLRSIEHDVKRMNLNLTTLDNLVADRISSAEFMEEMLDDVSQLRSDIDKLVAQKTGEMKKQISLLRKLGLDKLSFSIGSSLAMHAVRAEAASIGNLLRIAAVATNRDELKRQSVSLRQSVAKMDKLVQEIVPEQRSNLTDLTAEIGDLAKGRGGIVWTRGNDLDNLVNAQIMLRDSRQAAQQLTTAVEGVVEVAKTDIDRASLETESVQRFSTWVVIAAVAISLISSTLIVWLYVGRNLIARLSALSDSMLAIAKGDLKAELPAGGSDEIGSMAEALIVFRDNAVEIEEANLRELEQTRRQLTDAIGSISEGFSLYDADDKLVIWNDQYREVLYPGRDYPAMSEVIRLGTPFETVIRAAAEHGYIDEAEGRIDEWVSERLAVHSNPGTPFVQQRGEDRWVQINERKTEDGGTVGVYSDITELKRAEVQMREAKEAAEESNRTKSAFLANMSHELRTPLNAIIGFSEVLLEKIADQGPAAMEDPLGRIHSSGEHLLRLINDVLDIAKIEAGKMELRIEAVELPKIVQEAAITVRPMAETNGNRIDVICPDEFESVQADTIRVRQILLNLLSNAAKFTENGSITVELKRAPLNGGSKALIEVTDSGIGMNPDQIENLFTEFVQYDDSSTRKFGGTGLGLAISQRLCSLMNGEITVESEVGKGSTFAISLPLGKHTYDRPVPAPRPAQKDESTSPAPRSAPEDQSISAKPVMADGQAVVLVIDDDASARELLNLILTKEGYRVVCAADGEEGLRLARELHPVAVTLDVLMPAPDGWSLLSAFKADPELHDTPIVMITIVDEATRGYALGAVDYLTKPIDQNRLLTVVRRLASARDRTSILVVEDDDDTSVLIGGMLEKAGYEVAVAIDGERALASIDERVPDLVLLDLMMPRMDGFEFITALRSDPSRRHVPVVVVTARNLTDEDYRRLNGSVDQILQKGAFGGVALLGEIRAAIKASLEGGTEGEFMERHKILYVEDNENNIVLLQTRLEERGYDVIIARDGAEGVAMAKSELPSLILMDMRLPVMDGWDATKVLKETEETRGIPIIGVSAHAMTGDREKAMDMGCDDYMTKPVDMANLRSILDTLLGSDDG